MNVKISWSRDCNIGAWGVVQFRFGFLGVHYCPDLLFSILPNENTKQGRHYAWKRKSNNRKFKLDLFSYLALCCVVGNQEYISTSHSSSWDPHTWSLITNYAFFCKLVFFHHWVMHYMDQFPLIFRSKWKCSLFVAFLYWAGQINSLPWLP